MKIRTRTFSICSVVIVVCVAVLTGGTSSQSNKDIPILDNAQTSRDIVGMYQEIIKLRQRLLDSTKLFVITGHSTLEDLIDATVKASEARIQLAQFRGKQDAVVEECNRHSRLSSL